LEIVRSQTHQEAQHLIQRARNRSGIIRVRQNASSSVGRRATDLVSSAQTSIFWGLGQSSLAVERCPVVK
jgi:hypothetical protein